MWILHSSQEQRHILIANEPLINVVLACVSAQYQEETLLYY